MCKTLLHIAVFVCLILSTSTHAQNLTIRLRGILISPDESSTISINGEAGASNTVVPELDFTYFFTNNIGVELILATSKHDMTANGTDVGDVDLGSVWLLPPTLTLQYHFMPEGQISPYVGAGLNLTLFYNEDTPGDVVTGISYSTSVGPAVQAGVDRVATNWGINLDVKKA